MKREVGTILEGAVSPDALLSHAVLQEWRIGPGPEGIPSAVVAPESEEELGEVLKLAATEDWKVLPAGQGTWLRGGGVGSVDLVVSTRRLAEIREYEPADLTFTAGAGLTLGALAKSTEPHGQWLPLDPPGGRIGSLGAMVACGSWGALRNGYGTPRDHILGVTVVSGEGTVLHWGGRVVKNVAGFDLTRLCIGSWGALGVITSVSARLFPLPTVDRTLILRAAEAATLLEPAGALMGSGIPLAALELIDPLPVDWLGRDEAPGGPGTGEGGERGRGGGLAVRLLGTREEVSGVEFRLRTRIPGQMGSATVLEGEESRLFHGRMETWEEDADLILRLSLLPAELGALLEEAGRLQEVLSAGGAPPPTVSCSCHVGAGLARVAIQNLQRDEGMLGELSGNLMELRQRLEARGGSLRLSHGPQEILEALGPWRSSGRVQKLMTGLKARFDPAGILAPGRFGL